MKKQSLLFFMAAAVLLAACATHRNVVSYEFPEAMSETVKASFKEQCDKGKALYDINCAKCHNVKKGRRSIIPDFDQSHIAAYEVRVMNPKHESEMTESRVNAEELALIMTFLTYKKKNK